MTAAEPDAYVVEHIREALAHDPRVAELGITVSVSGGTVFLTGDVATPERKEAVAEVVRPLVRGRLLHNALTVAVPIETEDQETIP